MAQSKTATKSAKKSATRNVKKSAGTRTPDISEDAVTIDRRRSKERRDEADAGDGLASAAAPKLERRKKVTRRRQIDPTTCERDYSEQEVEFMNALDEYKRKSGRMFPTCSEVLEVIQSLGYVKMSTAGDQTFVNTNAVSAKPMPVVLPSWGSQPTMTETI